MTYLGALQMGSSNTTVIDSSRNLVNIGTISSGAITSSSSVTALGTGDFNNSLAFQSGGSTNIWKNISIRRYLQQSHADALSDGTHLFTASPGGSPTDDAFLYGAFIIQCRDNSNTGFAVRIGNGSNVGTAFRINSGKNAFFTGSITSGAINASTDTTLGGIKLTGNNAPVVQVTNGQTTSIARMMAQTTYSSVGTASNHPLQLRTNDTTALTLDTSQNATFAGTISSGAITSSGNVSIADSQYLYFGASNDFFIQHNTTNTILEGTTGDIIIQNNATDKDIVFKSDDGSGGLATYITIDGSASLTKFDVNTKHLDNVKATFGDSADLEIYHDGSHSIIHDNGAGDLKIKAQNLRLQDNDGTNFLVGVYNAQVEIMHNNQKRFETTSTGVQFHHDVQYTMKLAETTTSATTQTAIHTLGSTGHRSARYTVQVTNSTDSTYMVSEILLIHDGTTPSITEYGVIFTGAAREAAFDADISSGSIRLLATPASTDTMVFKVVAHSIDT